MMATKLLYILDLLMESCDPCLKFTFPDVPTFNP